MLLWLVAAALAAYLWTARPPGARLRGLRLTRPAQGPTGARRTGDRRPGEPDHAALTLGNPASGQSATGVRPWWTAPWLSSTVTLAVLTAVVGGVTGLVMGMVAGVAVWILLRHTSTATETARRARVLADLPLVVDLLVACVLSGRAPGQALSDVTAAVGGPVADELRPVCARLDLGADARVVWADLALHDTLGPLGRALCRSARTGSAVSSTLARCAEDLRRDRRVVATAQARTVAVRASAPLGACFLPAFLLIGVVPTIVGAFASMQW